MTPAGISHVSSSLFICLLGRSSLAQRGWRAPQRQHPPAPQHPPSPRWCSWASPTHTHLQPTSPAATPSTLPSSLIPGTGWASLRWGSTSLVCLFCRTSLWSLSDFLKSLQVGWSTTKDYHTFVWVEPCLDVVGEQTARQAVFKGEKYSFTLTPCEWKCLGTFWASNVETVSVFMSSGFARWHRHPALSYLARSNPACKGESQI